MTHMGGCWLQASQQEEVRTELSLQPHTWTLVLSRAQSKQRRAGEETRVKRAETMSKAAVREISFLT